jgi:sortase (surface protein transpeptidase)
MRSWPSWRRPVRGTMLGATAVVAVLALVSVGCSPAAGPLSPEATSVATETPAPAATAARPDRAATTPPPAGVAKYDAVPAGEPVRVVIPAIGVDANLVPVGLAADGSMQVPDFGMAAWYTEGPRPGHPGPSVVVAHVDSWAGPDVFHRLGELTLGDEIHVVYDSGDRVTFLAASSTQTPKDALPIDDIWPLTRQRMLTLVTCGGIFDRSSGHYRDNIIVYTTLAPHETSPRVPG